jgi:DNA invertase Pin-like site-specific DNA recombinase
MSSPNVIAARHLERLALVYVRQSTLMQVRMHTESTARQYAQAGQAAALGWDASKIVTIDADLGLSGQSASGRAGFKELVSRVCVGEVGAVFGLEVSRLARSSADLQRLLEFCSISDTLIVDADGVYDLRNFNDRLVLGFKGTMSEAELHVLAGRLQASKRAAAARGALRFPLPVGYVVDDEGQTVLDSHEEIRAAVSDLFSAFETAGSAYGVVRAFRDRPFPCRAYGGVWAGQLRWGRLTHGRVLGLLSNPTYAGAYVFGRSYSRRVVDAAGTISTRIVERLRADWPVAIQGHHPAYISWEKYLANEKRLAANDTRRGARPPREGTALLQGIVLCGSCGKAMSVVYPAGKATYDCSRSRSDGTTTPGCRSVQAAIVDGAVAQRAVAIVTPDAIRAAFAAADEVTDRVTRRTRALELRVERARYETARAERAFHCCEPENRLVARTLEQRWEDKLRDLAEAETAVATAQTDHVPLPPRAELEGLASDLPRLWRAETTSDRDRKRLLRTLVTDVTLISTRGDEQVRVGIRWRAGATDDVIVRRPPSVWITRRTPSAAVEIVRRGSERSDEDLVTTLNGAGLVTGTRRPFDVPAVRWIRYAYKIPSPPRLAAGELTVAEVAVAVGVAADVVYYWIGHGQLAARRDCQRRLYIPFSAEVREVCLRRVEHSSHMNPGTQTLAAGGVV